MTVAPDVAWRLDAQLGEGPLWLAREAALYFVDIHRGDIHRYHPDSDDRQTLHVGGSPSFIVPAADGGLLVGSRDRVHRLEHGQLGRVIATIPQPSTNRTNDATVDPFGRVWFGTLDETERAPIGAVWCLAHGTLHRAGGAAIVTNGPAVSADGRVLYHVDTLRRTIWRFPLRPEPELSDGEVFVQLTDDEGYPDGVSIDSEDCLWVALWDGWGVRRYAPDGRLLLHLPFPCARVTKLALGGPQRRTAYVTTARTGLDAAQLTAQPMAGSLFRFEAPAAGLALPAAIVA